MEFLTIKTYILIGSMLLAATAAAISQTTGYTLNVTDLQNSISIEMKFSNPDNTTYVVVHNITSNGSHYFTHSGGGTFQSVTVYNTSVGNVTLEPGNYAQFTVVSTSELFDMSCGIGGWTGNQGNVPIRGGKRGS